MSKKYFLTLFYEELCNNEKYIGILKENPVNIVYFYEH